MRRILNFFKSRRVIITIGFLSVIMLIWLVLGMWLGLGAMLCLIATCVVLLFLALYLFWEQSTAAKNSDQLERSIWEQSEEQKLNVRPERREEIELLRQQLSASIQKLKKSKLGAGKRGTAALYALPWYMIIGPPAAGKTTAIKSSGLEFPFGTDHEIQGVGGTRNCDWWFSNSAIILDTAGRYTTEEDDQEEWFAFLDTLKKNRRRRPINGVLICISIADLLNASIDELEWHAKTVRKRMDELTQRLGLRFPVYLVFTKCDLLNGFVEFFEEFSRTQRESVWGCTLSNEQFDDKNPKALFEREFQVLHDALIQMRFARLSPGLKREYRGLIFAFPMEFLSAKENLSYFVGKVFQPNPYQESPVFRGFYFTSGTQEGVPIDRVIQTLANAFGLTAETAQQFNPEMQTKSYFIKDLFTDIIIPDDRLVRLNSRGARNKRLLKVGVISAAVAGLLLIVLGVTQAFFRSKSGIEATAADIELLKSPASASMNSNQKLDVLLKRIKVLQDPPFFVFGMDRSESLLEPMRKLYFRQLYPFVQTSFVQPLQERLGRGDARGEAYVDLKAYLLLTKETDRLQDDIENQKFLYGHLTKMLEPKIATTMGSHVDYLVQWFGEVVSDSLAYPFPSDSRAIASARFNAGRLDIGNIYENLKRKLGNVQPYSISDALLRPKGLVRGIYTIEGAVQLEDLIESGEFGNLNDEAKWVLGTSNNQLPGAIQDESQIGDSLRSVYYKEYANEWWAYLEGIDITPFESLSDGANRMKQLSDIRNSPLKKLFEDVVRNTRFAGQAFKGFKDKFEKKVEKVMGNVITMHPVDRDFKDLHAFVGGDPDKKSDLDGAIAQLGSVSDELEALSTKPSKDAKECAQQFNSGALSLSMKGVRGALKSRDDRTRRAISGLFEQPIRYSSRVILSRTMEYLNEQWSREVIDPYRQLAALFPFQNVANDAPLSEVAEVFSGTGKLWTFVDKELKPFVEEADQWEPKKWEGEGLELSSAAKMALLQARLVSGSLFRGSDAGMKVDVRIELPIRSDESQSFDKVCFSVGGLMKCLIVDDGKPASFSFDWPGEGGASVKLVRESGKTLGLFGSSSDEVVEEKGFDGGWALFRLVGSAARMPSSSRSDYRCKWTFRDGTAVTCVIRSDKGFNNPFSRSFSLSLPDKLN
jgi:type VI secretion system protein ImpL